MRRIIAQRLAATAAVLFVAMAGSLSAEEKERAATANFAHVGEQGTTSFELTAAEKDVPQHFRLKPHTFNFDVTFERKSGDVHVHRLTFPSPVKTEVEVNNTVHGHYFQPRGKGPFSGVVVLHILGGEFALSQMIANSLAQNGVAALFIKMPYYGERRDRKSRRRMISPVPQETAEGMTQAVLDIRRAAAWIGARREVDAAQLGVNGISLGGIMSALSASAEPRFRKVAIYLGGGRLAPILWDMEHRDADRLRRDWTAQGRTREDFVKILRPVDPVTWGGRLADRRVLMVNALHDEIIPKQATMALWNAIGREPELVWLDAGHITAARHIFSELERLNRFFAAEERATRGE
ncbi:MAG: hypothetical protein CMJ48_06475 [Planctomycetaceae bacterium]|nr:hypothetical protein [Planctomycetaceae bacterium]